MPHLIPLAKHNSVLHGVAHWSRVHRYGLLLAESLRLTETQKLAIVLFAWTHDMARINDGGGNQHSIDGAEYVRHITDTLFSDFPDPVLHVVQNAIRYHSDGMNAEEALYELPILQESEWSREQLLNIIGCCWDADRLDLLRLGMMPLDHKMSTPYWKDVLPLAARLNKMTFLLDENNESTSNEDDWFIR